MSDNKKYYWLRLKRDFFNNKEVKKLRRIAGGDTFTIIYLKMQLLSIKNGGLIKFERTEDDLAEQLSLELDEEYDNVKITLSYMIANNLIEDLKNDEYLLSKVPALIGSETDAAERMRKMRERNNVTLERNNVTPMLQSVTQSKSKEIEINNINKRKEKKPVTRFSPPSPTEVTEYAKTLNFVLDGEQFCAYYEARGWMLGKVKMKSWKAAVVTWKKMDKKRRNSKKKAETQYSDEYYANDEEF